MAAFMNFRNRVFRKMQIRLLRKTQDFLFGFLRMTQSLTAVFQLFKPPDNLQEIRFRFSAGQLLGHLFHKFFDVHIVHSVILPCCLVNSSRRTGVFSGA